MTQDVQLLLARRTVVRDMVDDLEAVADYALDGDLELPPLAQEIYRQALTQSAQVDLALLRLTQDAFDYHTRLVDPDGTLMPLPEAIIAEVLGKDMVWEL